MQNTNRRRPVTPMDTVGGYGAIGQVLTSNGPNAPPSFQAGLVKTLTNYTGTSTNATVSVFDVTDANGVGGCSCIKNTGGVNNISVKFTYIDMFGAVGSTSLIVLTPGTYTAFDHQSSPSTPPAAPYQEVKLTVIDSVGGSHSTYSAYKLQW